MSLEKLILTVLGGSDPEYPPSGWHDIHGETGKSALIWSLCSWRHRRNGKLTLLVQLMEPYEYEEAASWAGMERESVYVLLTHENCLGQLVEILEESDEIGQVILEGLGFLIGSGKVSPKVDQYLGPLSNLFRLKTLAEQKDIALYTTSYSVYHPTGMIKTASLGGSILLHLCTERRIFLRRLKYYSPHGYHTGEKLSIQNILDSDRACDMIIKYQAGPVSIK